MPLGHVLETIRQTKQRDSRRAIQLPQFSEGTWPIEIQGIGFSRVGSEPVLERFVSMSEIKLPDCVLLNIKQELVNEHFAGSIVPCIDIERLLVEDQLAVYMKTDVPCQGAGVQLQDTKTQFAPEIELVDQSPQESLEFRGGCGTVFTGKGTPANLVFKKLTELNLSFGLRLQVTKDESASLNQLIETPPRVTLSKKGNENVAIPIQKKGMAFRTGHDLQIISQLSR
jgi:hypothetical protein